MRRASLPKFWPGPLTLILKRSRQARDFVTGAQDTVGLRVPSHPVAQELLRLFDGAIAAPSANRFGLVSPTTAAHVRDDLGKDVDLVLEGGASDVGIESTIVDLSGATPVLLRPGHISKAEIEALIGAVGEKDATSPRHSGGLERHYAPRTPAVSSQPMLWTGRFPARTESPCSPFRDRTSARRLMAAHAARSARVRAAALCGVTRAGLGGM